MSSNKFRSDADHLIEVLQKVIKLSSNDQVTHMETAKTPSSLPPQETTEERWHVELIENNPKQRIFRIMLSQESHILAVQLGFWQDRIKLDGNVFVTITGLKGTWPFTLSNGSEAIPAVISAKQSDLSNSIKSLQLTIAGQVVWSE
jgi:hypothetical protein